MYKEAVQWSQYFIHIISSNLIRSLITRSLCSFVICHMCSVAYWGLQTCFQTPIKQIFTFLFSGFHRESQLFSFFFVLRYYHADVSHMCMRGSYIALLPQYTTRIWYRVVHTCRQQVYCVFSMILRFQSLYHILRPHRDYEKSYVIHTFIIVKVPIRPPTKFPLFRHCQWPNIQLGWPSNSIN